MMQIEDAPVGSISRFPGNPRKNADAVAPVAASLRAFGFRQPIVVDSNRVIVVGDTRYQAALSLGLATVPVHVAHDLSPQQAQAYRLADNKTGEVAEWDSDLLAVQIGELSEAGFDMAPIGFTDAELRELLTDDEPALSDPDDVPEPPAIAATMVGDVWIMGKHRLMCGDSTNPEHVARLSAGVLADICFTSPPYGQQREYQSGGIGDWAALMRGVFALLPVKPDAQVLVNLGMIHRDGEWVPYWDEWIGWMREQGWRRFGWYVWDKGQGLPGDWHGRLAPCHEFIFHLNRNAEAARKTKPNKTAGEVAHKTALRTGDVADLYSHAGRMRGDWKIGDSVIRVTPHKVGLGAAGSHPAVFPVALADEMLTAFSDSGDVAFEPFAGSGTQLIAAQQADRFCLAMELAPAYCDVGVKRWQTFTGMAATLEATGQTFAEIEAERASSRAQAAA